MAGTIIADFIRADANKFSINVGNTIIASVNALGILSNTGNVMINSSGVLEANSVYYNGSAVLSSGRVQRVNQPAGSILQVVQTFKANSFSTASSSFVDITGLSVDITPTSSTSKIMVFASVAIGNAGGNAQVNLLRNGTNIAQSTSGTVNSTVSMDYIGSYKIITYPIMYLDSPNSLSTQTYKLQLNANGSTAYVNIRANDNYYGATSSITVMEIAQ